MFGPRGADSVRPIRDRLNRFDLPALRRRARSAERELFDLGITFTVYSGEKSIDRTLPFDVIPRVLPASDWNRIETGVIQRVAALNLFLHDIYHDQKIIKDGVIPAELVLGNHNYRAEMQGFTPARGTYVHICGTDIVRDDEGNFRVLEDNARTPSGVSYVIENRHLMMRSFPDLAEGISIADVDDYGRQLAKALADVAPEGISDPAIALMSPGVYNSAYFEHIFLAREMGVPLVEGRDLVVERDKVYMRTIRGLEPVHVIYRRIDDDFLDPAAFRPDSALGVPGLFEAYRKGNVTLANAVGTGVADDKAVYAYMPRIVQYYLAEEPILHNVPTHICREAEGLAYTLEHLDQLVTKPVGESGGYGVVIGPQASKRTLADLRRKLKADPDNFISQPLVNLSVCPTLTRTGVEPRHVDLRPFAVTGESTWVLPGGLTRVALRRGSLIVNSSQGGGSKDTWVLV
ncbi:MAG: circularly permuted type 2 ATP-grasp protein [Nitrospirota bacterium]|nr:circularly permuted type 2 ATP-grasp protein [Nitrospirota bacterium]